MFDIRKLGTTSVPILKDGELVAISSVDVGACGWDDQGVWIARLYTPPKHRGLGYSRIGMQRLCAEADRLRINLWITPNAYGPMSNEDLTAWWERLGFKKTEDKGWMRPPA